MRECRESIGAYKSRDEAGLADTLLAQKHQLELLQRIAGAREVARGRILGASHVDSAEWRAAYRELGRQVAQRVPTLALYLGI